MENHRASNLQNVSKGLPYTITLPWSPTLDGLFELKQSPSRALNLAIYLASKITEKQGQSLICYAPSLGPRTQYEHKPLTVCFSQNFFF